VGVALGIALLSSSDRFDGASLKVDAEDMAMERKLRAQK
jgi:hypothetical protein